MSRPESFLDVFFARLGRVHSVLESYIEHPSEKNIHDIRTSIRRLEAAYSVFPKSGKTKQSKRMISMYRSLFSLNSLIRDHDIILEKLAQYGYDPSSRISVLTNGMKLKRLSKALDLAAKISKSGRVVVKTSGPDDSRSQKRIIALVKSIKGRVPAVMGDEGNMDELHSLRKDAKKLRYVLELFPADAHDKLITNLKFLQKLAGDIHDCDVFVGYLEKNRREFPDFTEIVASEKNKRSELYQKLVQELDSFRP